MAPFLDSGREIRMTAVKRYGDTEAADRLAETLPQWQVEGGQLCRRYTTNGWRASVLLATGIAHLAELAWHHPDLVIRWGSVEVRLRTHSEGAITDKDFELAAMIEKTASWRPDGGSALEGAPGNGQWRYIIAD